MTQPPTNAEELLQSIIDSRGGPSAFSPEQMRIARALTIHLSRDDIDPILTERLSALLPSVIGAGGSGPHYEDLSRLTDEELDQYEQLVRKAIVPGEAAAVDACFEPIEEWERRYARLEEQLRIAQQGEVTYDRVARNASAECDRLRAEVDRLQPQLGKVAIPTPVENSRVGHSQGQGEPSPAPSSNVVAMPMHGNGSLTVERSQAERYPHLRDPSAPPVRRW
jgi:hypothetical protein